MDNLYHIANAHVYLSKSADTHELSYAMAGKLQLANTGWLVVQVPASVVRGAFDAIHEEGLELPPQYAIPVMSPQELKDIGGANKVTERGHAIPYTFGPTRSYDPSKTGVSKIWYIQIYSPRLKRLRNSYGLTPFLPNTHSYQLPIAIRKTGAITTDTTVTKVSEHIYLREPDWNTYDEEAINKIAEK